MCTHPSESEVEETSCSQRLASSNAELALFLSKPPLTVILKKTKKYEMEIKLKETKGTEMEEDALHAQKIHHYIGHK